LQWTLFLPLDEEVQNLWNALKVPSISPSARGNLFQNLLWELLLKDRPYPTIVFPQRRIRPVPPDDIADSLSSSSTSPSSALLPPVSDYTCKFSYDRTQYYTFKTTIPRFWASEGGQDSLAVFDLRILPIKLLIFSFPIIVLCFYFSILLQ